MRTDAASATIAFGFLRGIVAGTQEVSRWQEGGPGHRPDAALVRAFRRLGWVADMAASEALSPTVFTRVAADDAADLAKAAEKHMMKLGEVVAKVTASIDEFRKKVEAEKGG